MNLRKKKTLACKVFNVGRDRIKFNESSLAEIKEAITKQDIIDLHKSGAISIKPIKGKTVKEKRKRKGQGRRRKPQKNSKGDYVLMTRKLRRYARELLGHEKISPQKHVEIRKMIKNRTFKSKSNLQEYLK